MWDILHTCSLSSFQSLLLLTFPLFLAHVGDVELQDKRGVLQQLNWFICALPIWAGFCQSRFAFVSWYIQSVPASYLFPFFFIPRFHSKYRTGWFSVRRILSSVKLQDLCLVFLMCWSSLKGYSFIKRWSFQNDDAKS